MKYNTKYEDETIRFLEAAKKIIADKGIANLTKVSPNRSLQQNKFLHVLIAYFASQYGCTAEYAKRVFYKMAANKDLFRVERTNKDGNRFFDLRSSSALTTAEMSLSIDRFRHYAVMECGIYLPAAHETEFIAHCENQIELNKEFL